MLGFVLCNSQLRMQLQGLGLHVFCTPLCFLQRCELFFGSLHPGPASFHLHVDGHTAFRKPLALGSGALQESLAVGELLL